MKYLLILAVLLISGCGYQSLQNEIIGQPKSVINQNPVFCDNRVDLDLSLGVMRNGVGSMSKEDEDFTVPNQADIDLLKSAVVSGKLVKITYNTKRFTWCFRENIVTKVEVIQ